MPKPTLWMAIRDQLVTELPEEGQKLPGEHALAERFGVNRHTIRRALHDLVESGLLTSKRGAGFFAASTPVAYSLGQDTRFTQSVAAAGRFPSKRIERLERRSATDFESEKLSCMEVWVFEGSGWADNTPLAWFSSCFSADAYPDMGEILAETPSVTAAWRQLGVEPVKRQSTELKAITADALLAQRLRLRVGDPVMHTTGLDALDAQVVEIGESWFAASRVSFRLN